MVASVTMEQQWPAPADVVEPLGPEDAERLDRRIRMLAETARDNLVELETTLIELRAVLDEAEAGQIHLARGYASWTDYAADALATFRLELTTETRRQVVRMLTGRGMSQRAIARAVGAGKTMVQRDITEPRDGQVVHDRPPAATTGTDGKRYPRRRPVGPVAHTTDDRPQWLVALASAVLEAERALDGLLSAAKAAEPEIMASPVIDEAFRNDVDLLCDRLNAIVGVGIRLLPTPTAVGLTGGLNSWDSLEAIALDAIGWSESGTPNRSAATPVRL